MYVARITRNRIIVHAVLFEKTWSEELISNKVEEITEKKFIFRNSAYRWINAEISRILFMKKELDIIDD